MRCNNPSRLGNKGPTASVILPVYNAGKYLDQAIKSVLEQSYTDFELLLLNDGSTDGSLARLEYYAKLDSRCKLFSFPNQGIIATLNEGVRLARADLLLRMDADDLCRPERFNLQINYMQSHPKCVALGTRVMLIDPEGLPIQEFGEEIHHFDIDAAHLTGIGGSRICHPSVIMRKVAVESVGGYRSSFVHAEDIDIFLRLGEVGFLANLPETLLEYRQHIMSIGYQHAQIQLTSIYNAVVEARFRRGIDKLAEVRDKASQLKTASIADVHRKWAWWALAGGNIATARKHMLKSLRLNPIAIDNLKLIGCVLRGR